MERIYHPRVTQRILEQNDLSLKKSLGQNFLIDGNVLKRIVDSAELISEDAILEIGPGIGSLTEEILLRGNRLTSIEIDQRLYPILEDNFKDYETFRLIKGDATDKEIFTTAVNEPRATKLIANLPYVVTSPILERLFTIESDIDKAVIMVQREVAQRMTAKPKSKDYSALSVFISYFAKAEELFVVRESSFIPRPKIQSSVVMLKMNEVNPNEGIEFMRIVHTAFNLRRKTILNSLSHGLDLPKDRVTEILLLSGIKPECRAEELDVCDFIQLKNTINKIKGEEKNDR